MRTATWFSATTGIILAVLCARALRAQGGSQWIVDFGGEGTNYTLSGPGRTTSTPIHPLQLLRPGDRIAFKDDEGWVIVHLGPGQDKVVCLPGKVNKACDFRPVFTVPSEAGAPSFAGRMVSWVESQFERWFYGAPEAQRRETITPRDPAQISAPILSAERQLLAAGRRTLCLKWTGGSPPYHVEIRSLAAASLPAAFDVGVNSFCRANVEIMAGTPYSLTVSSGAQGVAYSVVGASPADLPEFPSLEEEVPVQLHDTLRAAWLAGQNQGEWAWEAYLRLVPSCEMSRAAADLCRALETGLVPTAPPK
jgi:hypothetical protein